MISDLWSRIPQKALSGLLFAGLAGTVQAQTPTTLQETYAGWRVECAQTGEAQNCRLTQDLISEEANQRIVTIGLRPMPEDQIMLTLVTPFGLDLATGVTLGLDGTATANVPFQTCEAFGCLARAMLGELETPMTEAAAMQISFAAVDGAVVTVQTDLAGFADGLTRLRELAAP